MCFSLSWNFQSKSSMPGAPLNGSLWAEAAGLQAWCPPKSWAPVLLGAGGQALLGTLFTTARQCRAQQGLASVSLECLLSIAQLGDGELWGASWQAKEEWQRAALSGAMQWLQQLQAQGGPSGDELRAASTFFLRLFSQGKAGASLGGWGGALAADGVGFVEALSGFVVCAFRLPQSGPEAESQLLAQGEDWQKETVRYGE